MQIVRTGKSTSVCGAHNYKWDIYFKPLYSKAHRSLQKMGVKRYEEPEVEEKWSKMVLCGPDKIAAIINSQHKVKLDIIM